MSSEARRIAISFLFCMSYIFLIASAIGFYWSLGLPIMFDEWQTSFLPVCLISVGTLTVLIVSWKISSSELSRSKKLSRRIMRMKHGRRVLEMIFGWELVSVVYLLVNVCLVTLKLWAFISPFLSWQDSIFYTFILSQLASSICVATLTGLIGHYA